LSVSDYISRKRVKNGQQPLTMEDVSKFMVKAHEIQGVLALENSFNRVGLDHVLLVKIASTALSSYILGATKEQAFNAISNSFLDGGALRTYRHFPNTGSRKRFLIFNSQPVGLQVMLVKEQFGTVSTQLKVKWVTQQLSVHLLGVFTTFSSREKNLKFHKNIPLMSWKML
jgi:2-methylcitrate dehydratase